MTLALHPHPKCRVNWQKPNRNWTICNYVDEVTNECKQTDWKRCPCGGIVRTPLFDRIPYKESERRVDATHTSAPAPVGYTGEDVFGPFIHGHNAQVAKAAREQFASAIIPALGRAIQTDISDNDYVMMEDLESTIGLLLQPEPQP